MRIAIPARAPHNSEYVHSSTAYRMTTLPPRVCSPNSGLTGAHSTRPTSVTPPALDCSRKIHQGMRGRNCIHRSRREAIELHRQGLQEDGLQLPEPQAFAEYVAVL